MRCTRRAMADIYLQLLSTSGNLTLHSSDLSKLLFAWDAVCLSTMFVPGPAPCICTLLHHALAGSVPLLELVLMLLPPLTPNTNLCIVQRAC